MNLHDRYLLVDCGEGTQLQLRRNRIKFQRINHIFISHLHGDHYLGLPGLVSSMHLLGRKNDLHIYAPEPLQELMELNLKYSDTFLNFELIFHPHRYDDKHLILDEKQFEVHAFPMKHRIDCCGFYFTEKPKRRRIIKEAIAGLDLGVAQTVALKNGEDITLEDGRKWTNAELTRSPYPVRSYAYCSDTAPFERQLEFIGQPSVLYHEATFLDDLRSRAKDTFHSTALQAAEVAKNAQAGELILGHFSSRYDETDAFEAEAKALFPRVRCARDGAKYVLDNDGKIAQSPVA